jgi:exosortase
MTDSQRPSIAETAPAPSPVPAWVGWTVVVAGLFAFRAMLTFTVSEDLTDHVEDWLFMPSNTAPIVVLLLSGWLFYRRRAIWQQLPPESAPLVWVLLPLAAGVLIFAWAMLTGATNLLPVSLALLILGTAARLRGVRGVRAVALPSAFLLFAVPLPGPLNNALVYQFQTWTTQWAGWLLYWMGSSAFVSGELIVKPEETFAVIEGCSGMRSVETLTMLSVLLVDLFRRRGIHAILLVIAAPGVAFLMNGVRVLTLIFNPHSEIIAIHNLQGVGILLGGLVALYLIDAGFEKISILREPSPEGSPLGAAQSSGGGRAPVGSLLIVGVWGICAVLSVLVPQWPEAVSEPAGLRARLSEPIGQWHSVALEIDRDHLGSVWFAESIHRRFQSPEGTVDLFLGVGDRSLRGLSILSPKTAIPESGFRVIERGDLELGPDGPLVQWGLLRSDARRVLVYHWYVSNTGLARESIQAALGLQASPFRMSAGEILVVRLTADVEGPGDKGLTRAREQIKKFSDEIEPILERLVGGLKRNQFS